MGHCNGEQLESQMCGLTFQRRAVLSKDRGVCHSRYATTDKELAKELRENLVESYIRYNTRFPENGNRFPHKSIHIY